MDPVSPRMTVTAWVWLFNATVFALPPWHKHDLIVSLLCVMLILYETGIWKRPVAGDGNGPGE